MTRLQQTIKRARRRQTLNRMIHAAGVGIVIGLAMAIVLLLLQRTVLGGADWPWHYYTVIAAAGLIGSAIWPILRLPDLEHIALQLDRALRLQDRIATAHALTGSAAQDVALRTGPRYDSAFAEMVQRDADRVACIIDVRNVVPIRITGIWGAAVIAALTFTACFLFVPSIARGQDSMLTPQQQQAIAQQQLEQMEIQREQLLQNINDAIKEIPDDAPVDARQQLEALNRLAQQLQAEPGSEEELQQLRDESAALMNQLSQQLADQAQRDQMAAQQLAERFSKLQSPQTPMSAEEFTEALKRGDFGSAADSLQQLLQQREQLTPQQRRELAEHLQSLSQQLDQAGQGDQDEIQQRAAVLEQALRDQGLDEQAIEQLLQSLPRSEEELAQQLLDEQVDEELARQLARELHRLQQQQVVQEQLQRDSDAVNQALSDAAHQLEHDDAAADSHAASSEDIASDEPQDQPQDNALDPLDPTDDADPAEPGQPDDPADSNDPDQPRQSRDPDDRRQVDQQPDQKQQQDQQDKQQSEQQRDQQKDDQQSAGDQSSSSQQSQRQQTQEESESDQQRQSSQQRQGLQRDETREQLGQEGQQPSSQHQQGAAPSDHAENDGQATDNAEAGQQQNQDAEQAAEQGQQQSQRRSPADTLREMQQRRQAAEHSRQSSQRMQQRARRMLDGQQQAADAADQPAQQQVTSSPSGQQGPGTSSPVHRDGQPPAPHEHVIHDLDLRNQRIEDGELIAEWMDESLEAREGDPQIRQTDAQQRVRQAQEIAERAVNEAAVPSRYHERIRRYFGRLSQTVDRAGSGAGSDDPQP